MQDMWAEIYTKNSYAQAHQSSALKDYISYIKFFINIYL